MLQTEIVDGASEKITCRLSTLPSKGGQKRKTCATTWSNKQTEPLFLTEVEVGRLNQVLRTGARVEPRKAEREAPELHRAGW